MKMRKKVCFCILFAFQFSSFAQIDTSKVEPPLDLSSSLEVMMENLSQNNDQELDLSELGEQLDYYSKHKININEVDKTVLNEILSLSNAQLYQLEFYIYAYGPLSSLYELAMIPTFDRKTIERLLPFVCCQPIVKSSKTTLKQLFLKSKNTLLVRYDQVVEPQQGYSSISEEELAANPNARYLGSKPALLLKYKFTSSNRLQFGFSAEKDAGEPFFFGKNKYGFDFYSAHFFLKKGKVLKSLALGDYQLGFGQGLCIRTGFAAQKPSNSVDVFKQAVGLKPYSSANELNFLRGVAATVDCKVLDLTFFYSYKKIDAALVVDTLDTQASFIEALQQTGYHRTQGEMDNKKAIGQHIAGLHLDHRMKTAQIGATALYTRFEHPLNRALQLYNKFVFNDIDNFNASIDYRVLIKKTDLFGEFALSKNGGFASLNGATFYLSESFSFVLLHRYYGVDYQSLQSGAIGENSNNSNEHGFYAGFEHHISRHFSWNAYLDYFYFPWLKYQVDAPSDGFEVQTKLDFYLNRTFSAYFRFRYKTKAQNVAGDYLNEIAYYHRQSYRLHLQWSALPNLVLKARAEVLNFKSVNRDHFAQGYLCYLDAKFSLKNCPLRFSSRFAVFDTYSYEERIYAYQEDVLYRFSVPAYYYKGSAFYLMVNYSFRNKMDIWFRVSQTFYNNKLQNGSGLTLIDGRTKTNCCLQVQLKL